MEECFKDSKEFLNKIFRFIDDINNDEFFKAVDNSKRIFLKTENESINFYYVLRGKLGGWPVIREMIDTLSARIFDNPLQIKVSHGYLKWFLFDDKKFIYICENLSDNLSKMIFRDFVFLSVLTAFTSINYLISPIIRTKLMENFDLIGLRNTKVWDIYHKNLEKRSKKISDKVVEVEVPSKKRLRFYETSPGWIIQDFFLNQYYHSKIRPTKGDVVLDLGAFNGITSLRFAASGAKRVYSFEFDPRFIKIIRIHSKLNGFKDIIRTVPKAVSSYSGFSKVVLNVEGGGSQLLGNNKTKALNVEVVTIDDWIEKEDISRIDFIKMDIEGEEINALNGMKKTLRIFHPKLAVSVYHRYSDLYNAIFVLKQFGYSEFYLSHRNPGIFDLILFAI